MTWRRLVLWSWFLVLFLAPQLAYGKLLGAIKIGSDEFEVYALNESGYLSYVVLRRNSDGDFTFRPGQVVGKLDLTRIFPTTVFQNPEKDVSVLGMELDQNGAKGSLVQLNLHRTRAGVLEMPMDESWFFALPHGGPLPRGLFPLSVETANGDGSLMLTYDHRHRQMMFLPAIINGSFNVQTSDPSLIEHAPMAEQTDLGAAFLPFSHNEMFALISPADSGEVVAVYFVWPADRLRNRLAQTEGVVVRDKPYYFVSTGQLLSVTFKKNALVLEDILCPRHGSD